jgi:hypothetical protein
MGKVWVLDTETKGTGAQVLPLETVLKKPAPAPERFVVRKPAPKPPEPPKAREPRRFRVTDVMTQLLLAEDAGTRETVESLRDVRSVVDVRVEVWDPDRERWRLLTHGEQKRLWEARTRPALAS